MRETPVSVVVDEIELGDQPPALLVRPDHTAPGTQPAMLGLHWLGHHRSDRTQLLPEAVRLAEHGVVSLLPQGVFPWLEAPHGDKRDAALVAAQSARTRHALDTLRAHPLVDPDRLAVVGHDYGAMYALTLRDVSLRGMVVVAPDATWDHWFHRYWHGETKLRRRYADQFRAFDPLAGARAHQDHLLLQWAGNDEYVEPIVRDLYACAAPRAKVSLHPGYDHELGDRAVAERFAHLSEVLELSGARQVA